ncbi:MAG: ParB/RepB/Spo0J family partition protein [Lachnospiraceae bacterium]|nr:ParB/RepB/Spo0J family partition protein [Lachnospiraceae bacterium]MCI9099752.1 ParB/RepB/Spo0J family partition protein [Lachnospiraceae bacterium]
MAVRKSGLGKGLDSLIPDHQSEKTGLHTESEESGSNDGVVMVKISKVEPNKNQPRKQFDEDSLLELADSIKLYGVLQPLLVLDKGNYYEIIAGERRWRAAKLAGIKEIPVLIKEYTEREIVEISLIENIQRENLNPIEEAIAYKRLLEDFNLKQDEIAERVAKSRTAVTNSIRLLKLDEKVQQMLIDEMISTGHARALLAITEPQEQVNLANQVFDEKLSVRETEKLIKKLLEPAKRVEKKEEPALDAAYEQMEEKMKGIIGTKVTIHRKKKDKGKIEIEYYSQDELERIIDIFESIG